MNGVLDLRDFLNGWPYDAESNVRIARGKNGREIILVRLPMGLEQYEVDGHPDGRRTHGAETVVDFHHARMHAAQQTQATMACELTAEDCAELFHEASAYYHRLTVLFHLKDWTRAERDAAQILRLLEFARQHVRCAEDRVQFDSWRPHTTRIHAVARAMIFLGKRQYRDAFQTARETIAIPETVDEDAPSNTTNASSSSSRSRCERRRPRLRGALPGLTGRRLIASGDGRGRRPHTETRDDVLAVQLARLADPADQPSAR